jgi:hypothetical protein
MCAEPYEWNVVIAGAWNVAILTPDGIKKRLFDLPASTPVRVEVAIDTPGYFRVVQDGLIVVPSPSSLQFLTERPDKDSLQKATRVAIVALKDLPQTPVVAAGVNIKYRFSELPNHLIEFMEAPIDGALSDANFAITARSMKRSLPVGTGIVNLELTQDESQAGALAMNFHLGSAKPDDLMAWLGMTEEFFSVSERVLSCMRVVAKPILRETEAP